MNECLTYETNLKCKRSHSNQNFQRLNISINLQYPKITRQEHTKNYNYVFLIQKNSLKYCLLRFEISMTIKKIKIIVLLYRAKIY